MCFGWSPRLDERRPLRSWMVSVALLLVGGVAFAEEPSTSKDESATETKPAESKPAVSKPAVSKSGEAKPGKKSVEFTTGSGDAIIEFINQEIRQAWKDNDAAPSPVADDAEWMQGLSGHCRTHP